MGRFKKTKFTGVFSSQSTVRNHNGRPDAAYYIVYEKDGKRKWEKVGWISEGYTLSMAHDLRVKRILEADGRLPTHFMPQRSITFDEAWEIAWDRHLKNLAFSENDLSRYKAHLMGPLGNLPLSEITSADIDAIKAGLISAKKSPATIKHIVSLVGRVFNLMAEWKVWDGPNPILAVKLPKADNRRTRWLEREEADRLLNELERRSTYTWQLAFTSLYTGMRAGEVMDLMGEHVDLARGRIRVVDTKNNEDRTVYIGKKLMAFLKKIEIKPGQPVFERPKGGSYKRVSRVFARAVQDLGLNDGRSDRRDQVVFHTLRHTFASWLVMKGRSLYLVGRLLGHNTPGQTQRYSHLSPDTQREAVEAIDEFDDSFVLPETSEKAIEETQGDPKPSQNSGASKDIAPLRAVFECLDEITGYNPAPLAKTQEKPKVYQNNEVHKDNDCTRASFDSMDEKIELELASLADVDN